MDNIERACYMQGRAAYYAAIAARVPFCTYPAAYRAALPVRGSK